ncbi:MAG: pyridoxal phosphate-dependent aminotransferase [Nitrospinales bacterium]
MAISQKINGFLEKSSWIRKMFEEGIKLKQQYGEENVFDLSLGNPVMEPPDELKQALVAAAQDTTPGLHRYMPNSGFADVREAMARALANECRVEARRKSSNQNQKAPHGVGKPALRGGVELTGDQIVMVCGAAGGLNITLKALLDPGDEVIVFSPYFVEYLFYADNHGGKAVPVSTREDFTLDFQALAAAINAKTKAVIINTPNNPTGVVYSRKSLEELGRVLAQKSSEIGHEIYLISDDPYKKIVFDGVETPNILEIYDHSIYITSHSKDLAVPGERIGFVAVHPKCAEAGKLMDSLNFCNRVLGFVNAPALIQRAIKDMQSVTVNVEQYRKKRDFLYGELTRIGYDVVRPQGAFYMFPRSPLEDETEFVRLLGSKKVLVVPGRGFGAPGYFRLSYCFTDKVIEGAIAGLEEAFKEAVKMRK